MDGITQIKLIERGSAKAITQIRNMEDSAAVRCGSFSEKTTKKAFRSS